jgi:orotidine-5'-phosphate decarboxylase
MTSPQPSFADRLASAVGRCANPVVVGLDPRLELLPEEFLNRVDQANCFEVAAAYLGFCCGVIDVVARMVPAVKAQAAFFEQLGPPGMQALAKVIQYAQNEGLLVILDAKRSDIGSTAAAYADAYLGRQSAWGADALTVNPYLGDDSLRPFVEVATERQAGLFVLVKTSNPGSALFQDLLVDYVPLYRYVARHVAMLAAQTKGDSRYSAVGAVVGATYPDELEELRELMPDSWFLVPGFGSQGATARHVAGAFDPDGLGAVINNSRGIIFAHGRREYRERNWQAAVEAATREMIEQLATETAAGRLRNGK